VVESAVTIRFHGRVDLLGSLIAAVAIVGIAMADAQVGSVTQAALNDNWRGLYDILVTSSGEDFGGSKTAGMVDSNFISTAGDGAITLSQLDEIRRMSGVEIAAPIGFVGTLRATTLTPSLLLMDDPASGNSNLSSGATGFRIDSKVTLSINGRSQVLSESHGSVALTQRTAAQVADNTPTASASPDSYSPIATNLYYDIPFGALPSFPQSVLAVDPKAEMKLLGKNGSFFRGLLSATGSRSTAHSQWSKRVDASKFLVQQAAIQDAESNRQDMTVVPMIVRSDPSAKLTLQATLKQGAVDADVTNSSSLVASMDTSDFASHTLEKDVSDLTVPFASPDLTLLEPGTVLPAGEVPGNFYGSETDLAPALIGRPQYVNVGSQSFRVDPKKIVGADGLTPDPSQPTETRVRAYRSFTNASSSSTHPLPAPIGEFTSAELSEGDTDAASYVPTGMYAASATKSDKSAALGGTKVTSNLSGLDFITPNPAAFTDMLGGEALRGKAPIDAIEIRVAGVRSFDARGRAKIEALAERIAGRGLRATVVAGSSVQPVAIYVAKYFGSGGKLTRPLGWVREEWTTLGAAARVENAMNGLEAILALVASLAAALCFAIAVLQDAYRRRAAVGVHRMVGLREVAILRRDIVRELPILALPCVAAIVVIALGGSSLAHIVAGVFAGFAVLAIVGHALLAMMRSGRRATAVDPHRPAVNTILGIAWRQTMREPLAATMEGLGYGILALAAGLSMASAGAAQRSAGGTRVAGLVFGDSLTATIVLGLAGVAAAVIMLTLGAIVNLRRRRSMALILRTAGIPRRMSRAIATTRALVPFLVSGAMLAIAFVVLGLWLLLPAQAIVGGLVTWVIGGVAVQIALSVGDTNDTE
jgi:hypothetical protein